MLETVYMIAAVAGAIGIPSAMIWVGKRIKRADQADVADAITTALRPVTTQISSVDGRLMRIEAQFGPNGGGLRQQVNETDTKVDKLAEGLAELRGAFAQYARKD